MKKKSDKLVLSIVGGVILLLILIAVNFVGSVFHMRKDLTEDQIYTLTDNTKRILGKLDTDITIKFYYSKSLKHMPVFLKNYARQVEDLLNEYKEYGKGHIILKKYDPKPDSDAADSAALDGIKGQMIRTGDTIYLGIAVTCLDKTVTIPFVSPTSDNLLEYEVTSAITQVYNEEKPIIGIMSPFPVMGEKFNPQMMQMGQMPNMKPWMFVSQLKKDFEVKEVPMTSKEIGKDIKVLVVVHPAGIKPETEFAIDQFMMRGGKLIAFVDPNSFFAYSMARQKREYFSMISSNLPTLFKKWNVKYDEKKVVADMNMAFRVPKNMQRMVTYPTVLELTKRVLDKDDIITSKLSKLRLVYAGSIKAEEKDGLKVKYLMSSTQNSCLEDTANSSNPETAFKNFKRDDEIYDMAMILTGKFKTAFPDGAPTAKDAKDKKKPEPKKDFLKESEKETMAIIVADSDMLLDDMCVKVQQFMNQQIMIPLNQNLQFVQNAVDFAGGDRELIGIRCRQKISRPFEVVQDLQAKAEQRYKEKVEELEKELKETQSKLNMLQRGKTKDQQFILSPEQKAELKKFQEKQVQVRKKLKKVSKELRQEIDLLQSKFKFYNIGLIPICVIIFGIVVAIIRKRRSAAK